MASNLKAASQTEAGLTLIEAPSARAAALGGAFTAMPNEISAIGFNPANLETLKRDQASLLYQQGIADDAFGHFVVGHPLDRGSVGLSVVYYDGGDATVFDGVTERTVLAQRDLAVGISIANNFRKLDYGLTLKYFSSELGETANGQTLAHEYGLGYFVNQHLRLGLAAQNLGARLKYQSDQFDLPQIVRAGAAYQFNMGPFYSILLFDVPYSLTRSEMNPAIGIETNYGPMALRVGYQSGGDLEEITIGSGFVLGSTQLDYSFGMVEEFDSRHRISVNYHFGRIVHRDGFVEYRPYKEKIKTVNDYLNERKPTAKSAPQFKKEPTRVGVVEYKRVGGTDPKNKVYVIKEGDTLRSIAKKHIGYEDAWDDILNSNKHLGLDPDQLTPGQKILIPRGRE